MYRMHRERERQSARVNYLVAMCEQHAQLGVKYLKLGGTKIGCKQNTTASKWKPAFNAREDFSLNFLL